MKTPGFWQHKSFISTLLLPLGCVYNFMTQRRIKHGHPKKVSRPVICIGNITAGGTGKTPVAISIAKLLQEKNKNPFFVSRGYGGNLSNILVDNRKHSALEVGDEPLLLSRQAPVVINPNRHEGALKALKSGAEIIIMDDGFQNPGLYKDLSFLVFDGGFGLGNERIVPSGPLRESLSDGIKRAQAIIIIGKDKHNLENKINNLPVFRATIQPLRPHTTRNEVIAFAGIGRPEKFYNSLRESGFNLLETIDFPDHHQYKESELKNIIAKAQKIGADIFTTSKDYVKIPAPLQSHFKILEIEIKWENPEKLTQFILDLL